jgi:hypothetical protein
MLERTPLWFWEYIWVPPVLPVDADVAWWAPRSDGSYRYGYIKTSWDELLVDS